MEIWSVDRIEGNTVILINSEKKILNVSLSLFSKSVAEGDVVVRQESGEFSVDCEKTAEKKRDLFYLQKKIFSDL